MVYPHEDQNYCYEGWLLGKVVQDVYNRVGSNFVGQRLGDKKFYSLQPYFFLTRECWNFFAQYMAALHRDISHQQKASGKKIRLVPGGNISTRLILTPPP